MGDGNCLFRACSFLLYGTESRHSTIRQAVCDYIHANKDFFEHFIDEDFDNYVRFKRRNGTWGDDLEIQAISEIYNRPIHIYSYSNTPLRTFRESEASGSLDPLSLSYH